MEVLKISKLHMKFAGVLNWQLSTPFEWFPITLITRIFAIFSLIMSSSTAFGFCFNQAKHLDEFSEAFVFALSHAMFLYWHCLNIWKQKQIEQLFESLQEKVQSSICKMTNYLFSSN